MLSLRLVAHEIVSVADHGWSPALEVPIDSQLCREGRTDSGFKAVQCNIGK